MFLIFINVIFVLSAVAMTVLILLQRGSGGAGSGFGGGGGASATVFGARGSANFLSKATKWLAVVFFSISLGLAWYSSRPNKDASATGDLGIMSHAQTAPTVPSSLQPAGTTPAVPQPTLPAATTPAVPTAAPSTQPAGQGAANGTTPAVPAPQPMASPASAASGSTQPVGKGG